VEVDESACKFKKKPVVVTSLTGVSSHWTTTGGSSVYKDTASSYRIYVHSKGILTANAQKWKWASDFLAQIPGKSKSGTCAGETPLGNTKWVKYGKKNGIYVDVDTSACGFSKTPVYKTSIGGASHHWTTTGASSVYKAKKNSFRIYIHQKDITVKNAKKKKYHIKWIAHPVGTITVPGLGKTCAGKTVSGKTAWKTYENGKGKGIYVDVKTGCNFWGATPRYVTEVAGASNHWTVTGTSEVYSPTATGFRMYLFDKSGITPSKANERAWSVQWIAAASEPDGEKSKEEPTPKPTPDPNKAKKCHKFKLDFKKVLKLAGYKKKQLKGKTKDGLRNTCISYNHKHRKASVKSLQKMGNTWNQKAAAAIITLKEWGYSTKTLKGFTEDDQRNTIITLAHKCTKKSVATLQKKGTYNIVKLINKKGKCCP